VAIRFRSLDEAWIKIEVLGRINYRALRLICHSMFCKQSLIPKLREADIPSLGFSGLGCLRSTIKIQQPLKEIHYAGLCRKQSPISTFQILTPRLLIIPLLDDDFQYLPFDLSNFKFSHRQFRFYLI
jgi:hypothetical protein